MSESLIVTKLPEIPEAVKRHQAVTSTNSSMMRLENQNQTKGHLSSSN